MKNFVYISPNFPKTYWRFCAALKRNGFRVLGIADCAYYELAPELKASLDDYYQVYNMEDIKNQIEAVNYFQKKYGKIDYIESNIEYWLAKDAVLREWFNIPTGFRPKQLDICTHKSMMKEKYIKAGVPVAKYIIVQDFEQVKKFAEEVDYPIFIKPNVGVGAYGDYKIKNEEDLKQFFNEKANIEYICEQYITGNIVSFDGVCDSQSNVIFCTSNEFPPSIAEAVENKVDIFYYTVKKLDPKFEAIGRAVIKAFEVKNRFFHLEFFRLTKPAKGVGKVGDIVALETNMRPAGGYTPDLINFANSVDCYQIWADSIAFDENRQDMSYPKYYAACASRRDGFQYLHSDDDIKAKYKDKLAWVDRYPPVFSGAMGDRFFMAKLDTLKEVEEFKEYCETRQ